MALVECISLRGVWQEVEIWLGGGCADGEKNVKKDVNLGRRVYKIVILF